MAAIGFQGAGSVNALGTRTQASARVGAGFSGGNVDKFSTSNAAGWAMIFWGLSALLILIMMASL